MSLDRNSRPIWGIKFTGGETENSFSLGKMGGNRKSMSKKSRSTRRDTLVQDFDG
jgi:hypothetical protein